MLTDSFRILEFNKIREMLKTCATSNFGKESAAEFYRFGVCLNTEPVSPYDYL